MSKTAKIILIVVVIVIILALIIVGAIVGVSMLLNREKDSITAEQFRSMMEQNNYTVADATYQFSQYDYVQQVYIAADSSYSYQIEFYELSNESNAIGFYNNNASIFQSRKGNAAAETNVSGKNFSKYTLSSGGSYMTVSRINNTIVYVDVTSEYEDVVKDVLDKIGY